MRAGKEQQNWMWGNEVTELWLHQRRTIITSETQPFFSDNFGQLLCYFSGAHFSQLILADESLAMDFDNYLEANESCRLEM